MDSFFKKIDLFNRLMELESSLIEAGINPEKIKVDEIPKIEMDEAEVGMVVETFKSAEKYEELESMVRAIRISPMKILEEYLQANGLELFFGCLYIANTDYFILRVAECRGYSRYMSNDTKDVPEDTIVGGLSKGGYKVKINELSQFFSFSNKKEKDWGSIEASYSDNTEKELKCVFQIPKYRTKSKYGEWEPIILPEHKVNTIFCADIHQKFNDNDEFDGEYLPKSIEKMIRYYKDEDGLERQMEELRLQCSEQELDVKTTERIVKAEEKAIRMEIRPKWEKLYHFRNYVRREIVLYNHEISKEYWDEIIKVRKRRYKRKEFEDIMKFQLVLNDVNEEIEMENLLRRYKKLWEIKRRNY